MQGDCEHVWAFQSVVYSHEAYPMAGTGARSRMLEDKYFCTKCLKPRYANRRYHGNSYEAAPTGAMPK